MGTTLDATFLNGIEKGGNRRDKRRPSLLRGWGSQQALAQDKGRGHYDEGRRGERRRKKRGKVTARIVVGKKIRSEGVSKRSRGQLMMGEAKRTRERKEAD